LATVSSLNFSSIDSLAYFGLLSADFSSSLGEFVLKVFPLQSMNWKWAIQGPGPQSLTSQPCFHWPQSRAKLSLCRRLLAQTAASSDPTALAAILASSVAATEAMNQFHPRAAEFADQVFVGSHGISSA